jgi:hypothetical protein
MLKPLQMPAVVTKPSKGRLTDLSGSFQMNDIQVLKRKKQEEDIYDKQGHYYKAW